MDSTAFLSCASITTAYVRERFNRFSLPTRKITCDFIVILAHCLQTASETLAVI